MNYAWRYDNLNGPGKFFSRFHYCFSDVELGVIRHSPHKVSLLQLYVAHARIAKFEKKLGVKSVNGKLQLL